MFAELNIHIKYEKNKDFLRKKINLVLINLFKHRTNSALKLKEN